MNFDTEVIIIGAGAAGIAAAHTLTKRGVNCQTLEARNHIGGRCRTDTSIFGVPYDLGAHWLHYGSKNFYQGYGKQQGFQVYPDAKRFHILDGQKRIENSEILNSLYNEIFEAFELSQKSGRDISAAQAISELASPYLPLASFVLGPFVMGKELDRISAADYATSATTKDWFCKQGFGTLVKHYGSTLNVKLETKVNRIDWSESGVKVTTNRGTISAKAVIVTISNGALAAESVVFNPKLTPEKQEAFHRISMGIYEHVALLFSKADFHNESDTYVLQTDKSSGTNFGALLNASGSGLAYCDIGGRVAEELIQEGESACIDFALSQLKVIFGSVVDSAFKLGKSTSWLTDPLTMGSYASAEPGYSHFRNYIREPVAERIYFAGESCDPTMWASVAGAHRNGKKIANRIADQLGD